MKNLLEESSNKFTIICKTCNRKNCRFEFTDSGNLLIVCDSCGNMFLIRRTK